MVQYGFHILTSDLHHYGKILNKTYSVFVLVFLYEAILAEKTLNTALVEEGGTPTYLITPAVK